LKLVFKSTPSHRTKKEGAVSRLAILTTMAMVLAAAARVGAQTKTITGETKITTVSVEAIERAGREVTVKKPDGTYDVLYVPETFRMFDNLKIGDKVTAKYYENIVLQLKAPGEKAVDTGSSAVVKKGPDGSGGTGSHQRTITATITAIDQKVPSITFSGPNGWTYSTRVEDKKALAKVKVGDRVDITWTEATVLSLDAAK
jgi:hypothetical protein